VLPAATAVIVGSGLTVTVVVTGVAAQPKVEVPLTVYTIVEEGVAVGFAQEVQERPVLGLHTILSAPLAVRETDVPGHILCGALTLSTGSGATVTLTVSVALQPANVVPVTVYVVVVPGVTEIVLPPPADGLHE
jgi:hypothetical protein